MRFRTVILISIWSVVAGALIVGYVMVNVAMRDQVRARTAADLRTHRSTLQAFFALQLNELGRTCELFAETPRLIAVTELGDRNTVRQLMSELSPGIGADIIGVADTNGSQLYGSLSGSPYLFPPRLYSPEPGSGRAGVVSGLAPIDTAVYRIASAPILAGTDVVGRLVIGFRITPEYLATLREMIESELALTVGTRAAVTTLSGEELEGAMSWISAGVHPKEPGDEWAQEIASFPAGSEHFLATFLTPSGYGGAGKGGAAGKGAAAGESGAAGEGEAAGIYGAAGEGTAVRLAVLKPVLRETEAALRPVIRDFVLLSAAVLLVTILVGFFVSRSVTRPIAGLVRGTGEISKGNYDYEIEIPKGVELKYLATKFGEMSASLKEKVRQLGERNKELELALRKLRETQVELIRSERLAATGKLTAQLSHEINNPVHNILSSLQTALKKTPADAPARELLEVAHDEVERLARLTKQLLTAYRESVSSPEPRRPLDINAVVREVAASSAEMLRQSNIETAFSFSENLPWILGSDDKLKQLFLNLIVNARDAMPSGGRLTIVTSKADGMVAVEVSDTGVGIPREHIDHIFDAFFTTKGKVSGTGLGLSVSYGIVQQHRGAIRVKSRPGEGSTFTVMFPTDAPPNDRKLS